MDFTIPAALEKMLAEMRNFVRAEVMPLEREFSARPFRDLLPTLQEKRARVRARGWWAPPLPRAIGGMGMPLTDFAHVSEELGRSPLGHFIFNCAAPDIGNMEVLLQHATPEQKEKYLLPLARGEIRSCFSMTEPDYPGSNPVWMGTTARKEGSDYVINGRKWYTSSADGAAFAVVMAVTNPDDPKPHRRASQIIVPTNTPGFNIVRNISVMGHAGDGWASHAEIVYDNCRVPQKNLLGAEGAGFVIAQDRLGPGRIHHCMRWIGICERAFELMCAHSASRQLAPGEVLAKKQSVQFWIAESRAEIDAARLMVLNAAFKMEREGAKAARIEISTIKWFVANVLDRVLDRAIQAHGGLGVTDDTPLAGWYRQERAARIYDGADEVHKTVVARQVLREYDVEI
ncbi:MAG: acyl-CoA dehydrogenase family protein [Chloroflexi bacterium]|nr:acyl-CoA dehydrogenase family protein [Chloroflexota bacterium]